jgi:hypothetical protein
MTFGQYAIGKYASGEGQLRLSAQGAKFDGSEHGILVMHGHGGDATQFDMLTSYQGAHTEALADAGFIVLSIDAGGPATWGNNTAMNAALAAYNWLVGAGKAKAGKVGVMGWSMGGLNSLNWIKRNASKVAGAWEWCPATDLDYFHGTAGYTPAYPKGTNTLFGNWAAEIDAAYGGNYAANAVGHKIVDEYSAYKLGIPITVAHAVNDNTIPVGQNQYGFVPGVADPAVTFRSVSDGDHTGLFNFVPTSEVVAFYQGLSF